MTCSFSGLAICGGKCQNPVDLPSGGPLFCLPTTSHPPQTHKPTIPQCRADPLPPLDFYPIKPICVREPRWSVNILNQSVVWECHPEESALERVNALGSCRMNVSVRTNWSGYSGLRATVHTEHCHNTRHTVRTLWLILESFYRMDFWFAMT